MHLVQPARQPLADRRPARLGERVLPQLPAHHLERRRRDLAASMTTAARSPSPPTAGSCTWAIARGRRRGSSTAAATRSTETSSARPRASSAGRRPRPRTGARRCSSPTGARSSGYGNRVTAGVAYDGHRVALHPERGRGQPRPGRQQRGACSRPDAFETAVDVRTDQQNIGVYADRHLRHHRLAGAHAGRRYQHVHIKIRDQSGENPDLDGDHTFQRFSPAVGLTVRALPDLTLFGSYSEGFRAPTAAELACADPNAPCNLPNAFIADPPLDPVVARTYEFGARGKLPRRRRAPVEPGVLPHRRQRRHPVHADGDHGRRLLPERGRDAPPGRRGRACRDRRGSG